MVAHSSHLRKYLRTVRRCSANGSTTAIGAGQSEVTLADAAAVVWDDRDSALRRILALVEAKGIPVHVIGAPTKQKVRKVRDPDAPEPRRQGMLPD